MLRRLIGLVIILTALFGVAMSVIIVIYGRNALDNIAAEADTLLSTTTRDLANVEETLALTRRAITDTNNTLGTLQLTLSDTAGALSDTRPLIEQVGTIATTEVPNTLDAVEEALPNVITVAGTVDTTLRTLSNFGFKQDFGELNLGPFGKVSLPNIDFDLGINYDPDVPLDETVATIGDAIDGLAPKMRDLETEIKVADENIDQLSQDLTTLSEDLDTISKTISDTLPLIDNYQVTVTDINDTLTISRARINSGLAQAKMWLIIVAAWFGLMQMAPLYMGLEMIAGRRDPIDIHEVVKEEIAQAEEEEDNLPIVHENETPD